MTDPALPPSFFSQVESSYNTFYNSASQAIGSKVYRGLSEASKLGGPAGQAAFQAAVCSYYPMECALEFANYAAYQLPKTALETSVSLTFWGGKKVLNLATSVARSINRPSPKLDDFIANDLPTEGPKASAFSTLYDAAAVQAEKLSLKATSFVTGKSVEDLTKKIVEETQTAQALGEQPSTPFKAIDLIGPSLLMGLCAHKTLENAQGASSSLYNLVTGKRLIARMYTTQAANCNMVGGCKAGVSKTKPYTAMQLTVDTVMQTAFTALWGAGTYFTYNGIYNAIEIASESSTQAAFITNAILTATLIAPTVLSWINEALTEQPALGIHSPNIAPHLAYIEPEDRDPFNANPNGLVGMHPITRPRLSGSSHALSFEEAVAKLNNSRAAHSDIR